jgi:hypothetical protein
MVHECPFCGMECDCDGWEGFDDDDYVYGSDEDNYPDPADLYDEGDGEEDEGMYWTCQVCGGEYWDGGTSCTCFEMEEDGRAAMALGRILSTLDTFKPEGEDEIADLIRAIAVEGLSFEKPAQ